MFYTHSKVVAVFIICLSLVVSVFLFKDKKVLPKENTIPISVDVASDSNLDSDGDGLKDWEEVLLGTNPNLKDTDGNGIDDGKEKLETFAFKNKTTNEETPKSTTLTEDIAQTFLINYLDQKKQNPQLTEEQIATIANTSTQNVTFFRTPDFEIKDIKISKNQTKDQYSKELNIAFSSGIIKKQDTEMQIIEKALINNDKNELKKLDPIINSYQQVINETLKVAVPEDNVGLHLVYLNNLKSVKEDIEGMKNILDDPASAYVYLNSYQLNIKKLFVVMSKLVQYFNS